VELSTINDIEPMIKDLWTTQGFDVVYQRCMLGKMPPGPDGVWPIVFPEDVAWTDRTVVIMNATDFFTVRQEQPGVYPELDQMEQHFGSRSDQVVVLVENIHSLENYRGPLNLIYFPTVFYVFCENMRRTKDQWIDKIQPTATVSWQCLNGRIDDRRRAVHGWLSALPNGTQSLGNEVPLPMLDYSSYLGITNEENFLRLLPIYQACGINVVTETCYAAQDGGITEKTLQAFMALQIPIVVGYHGLVRDLERMGFDMFRDVVDTAYDDIEHNNRRARTAIESNRALLSRGIDRSAFAERLFLNQQHALEGWSKNLLDDYRRKTALLQKGWPCHNS